LALISIITASGIMKCKTIKCKSSELVECLEKHRIYLELDLERNSRCNSGRLWRGQLAGKAWLGAHLDCITLIRFSIGDIDKGATECRGSMSDQLTVFSREAFVIVCKG